jgi:signal transduction histidine kinase
MSRAQVPLADDRTGFCGLGKLVYVTKQLQSRVRNDALRFPSADQAAATGGPSRFVRQRFYRTRIGRFFSFDRQIFGFALYLVLISLGSAHAAEPRRILLLYTETVTTASIALMESGVVEAINQGLGGNVELYREQFDAHQSPDRQREEIDWIRRRYSDRKIGVIICIGLIESDGMPINVLDVPTVYVGLKPDSSIQQRLDAKSEILWFAFDFPKTLELARHLQPKARRAIFLSGVAPRDKAIEEIDKEGLASQRKGPLDLEFVSGLSFQQMKELVAKVPSDTFFVALALTRDQTGANFYSPDMVRLLSEAAHVPIYTFSDTFVGAGAVGGSVFGYRRVGEMEGKEGLALLNGRKPRDNVNNPIVPNYYLFDGRQLRRWGFSERNLPPGSVILYRIPSVWESYRAYIVTAVGLILLLSLLVTLLLFERSLRKRTAGSLRELSGRLINAQEEERSRIARDLHDDMNQRLGLLAFGLSQFSGRLPVGEVKREIQELWEQTSGLSKDVHRLSHELHPATLEQLGLVAAARALCAEFSKKQGVAVYFTEHDVPPRLPERVSLCLYRILQESLQNIAKHSEASVVNVELDRGRDEVHLTVEDDGIGFDPANQGQGGLGLLSMRERLRLVGGSIHIESAPLEGTKVKVWAPISGNISAPEQSRSSNAPNLRGSHEPRTGAFGR